MSDHFFCQFPHLARFRKSLTKPMQWTALVTCDDARRRTTSSREEAVYVLQRHHNADADGRDVFWSHQLHQRDDTLASLRREQDSRGPHYSDLGRSYVGHKLRHFHWSLPRSVDSTGNKNDAIYVLSYVGSQKRRFEWITVTRGYGPVVYKVQPEINNNKCLFRTTVHVTKHWCEEQKTEK